MTTVYFVLLAIIAEILGTLGGFGSSIYFVPIANFFFSFQTVLGITAIFHIVSNLTKIKLFSKGVQWKLVLRIGIPAIIFVAIGSILSQYIDQTYFNLFISIVLLASALLLFIFQQKSIKESMLNSFLGGASSGFIAGIAGTGGAIRGLFLHTYKLSPEIYIATSAFIDLGVDVTRSIIYIRQDYVTREYLFLFPILIIVSIIGTFIGKSIISKLPTEKFRTISLILIIIVGLTLFIQSINSLYFK